MSKNIKTNFSKKKEKVFYFQENGQISILFDGTCQTNFNLVISLFFNYETILLPKIKKTNYFKFFIYIYEKELLIFIFKIF